MARLYEKLETLEHLLGLPRKCGYEENLEWIRPPNRTRITTWPLIDADDSQRDCHSAPPAVATPMAAICKPLVDFCEAVTVFFFDQEEGVQCGAQDLVYEGRVKTFDGRSEVPRCRIGYADLTSYVDAMCMSSEVSEEWQSTTGCFRRARSYHWEDLTRLICAADEHVDSMWLMEHMPCDCDMVE